MWRALASSASRSLGSAFRQQVAWACVSSSSVQHNALLHSVVTRDPAYSIHNDDDVDFFKSVLGDRGIVQDPATLEPMNRCVAAVVGGEHPVSTLDCQVFAW